MRIKSNTYYVPTLFLCRVLLARVATSLYVDWLLVSNKDLSEMTLDKKSRLGNFTQTMSAVDLLSVLFGRCDWALLVSLYTCLWGPCSLPDLGVLSSPW